METKITSRFIKVHLITTRADHQITEYFQRVDQIIGFGNAPEEYTKVGGSGCIDLPGNDRVITTENIDDLFDLLNKVDYLP